MEYTKIGKHLADQQMAKHTSKVVRVLKRITTVFDYAEASLDTVAVYFVIRPNGAVRWFKTIKGFIVMDKLGSSYLTSREVKGSGSWSIDKIYKICFETTNKGLKTVISPVICDLSYADFVKVLDRVGNPRFVCYTIGTKDSEHLACVKIDMDLYGGLPYKELRKAILDAYYRKQPDMMPYLDDNLERVEVELRFIVTGFQE